MPVESVYSWLESKKQQHKNSMKLFENKSHFLSHMIHILNKIRWPTLKKINKVGKGNLWNQMKTIFLFPYNEQT